MAARKRKILTLQANVLRAFNDKFLRLSEVIKESTVVYDFYRGEIYETKSGLLGIDYLVTNDKGCFRRFVTEINQDTKQVFYSRNKEKFHFSARVEAEIIDCVEDILVTAESFNFSLTKIYFEFSSKYYRKATAELDPKEPGSYIMYLFCDEDLRSKYDLASGYNNLGAGEEKKLMKEICGDWEGNGRGEYKYYADVDE